MDVKVRRNKLHMLFIYVAERNRIQKLIDSLELELAENKLESDFASFTDKMKEEPMNENLEM